MGRDFPIIQPDRHVYSFRDGIYFAETDKFISYKHSHRRSGADDDQYRQVVSYKYFDTNWCSSGDERWQDMRTPLFESILQHQGLETEVIQILYAFFGRLLYPLNFLDKWQVALFIEGVAGTGKSTIGQVLKEFFHAHDVGTLTCGNHEKRFGLSALYHKLMYMCFEAREEFGLTQDVLQSMISGEGISVPIKNQTATDVNFNVPGIFFGNEFGQWKDTSGSISRRFLVCRFEKCVSESSSDPNLLDKIRSQELALLLRKMNCAYLDLVRVAGDRNIWSVINERTNYFKQTQFKLKCSGNSLFSYIFDSGEVEVKSNTTENTWTPLDFFNQRYKTYCKTSGLKPLNIKSTSNQHSIFEACNIGTAQIYLEVDPDGRTYCGKLYYGTFINGLSFNDHFLSKFTLGCQ
jgi:phage/plasmid-associated DNA primase